MLAADRGAWPHVYPADLPGLVAESGARRHQLFLGRRQTMRPPWLMTVMTKALRMTFGDRRDWDAIEAWARGVGDELRALTTTPPAAETARPHSLVAG